MLDMALVPSRQQLSPSDKWHKLQQIPVTGFQTWVGEIAQLLGPTPPVHGEVGGGQDSHRLSVIDVQ
jgi:hypothetical protein